MCILRRCHSHLDGLNSFNDLFVSVTIFSPKIMYVFIGIYRKQMTSLKDLNLKKILRRICVKSLKKCIRDLEV